MSQDAIDFRGYAPGGEIDYPVSKEVWFFYASQGLCPYPPAYLFPQPQREVEVKETVKDMRLYKENINLKAAIRQCRDEIRELKRKRSQLSPKEEVKRKTILD